MMRSAPMLVGALVADVNIAAPERMDVTRAEVAMFVRFIIHVLKDPNTGPVGWPRRSARGIGDMIARLVLSGVGPTPDLDGDSGREATSGVSATC